MLLRAAIVTLINLCVNISNTSPNENNEMGSHHDDKVAKDERSAFTKSRIVRNTLYTILTINYTYNHFDANINWYDYILMTMIAIGFILRIWSYVTLGRLFTFTVGTRSMHTLVTTGPYRFLAHPGYTGVILINIFSILFLRAHPIFVILVSLYIIYGMNRRISFEEQFMRQEFGEKYDEFISTRSRLIPFIF